MARSSPPLPTLSDPGLKDWLVLAGLVLLGGSAFVMIKAAVLVADPAIVAAGRLWVAAILLLAYSYASGHSLPPLLTRADGRPAIDPRWVFMILGGIIGYTIPFTLFPVAQQHIDSMLAGIYMAFMPLMTIITAYFFAGESLTWRKGGGFLLGTLGVIFLIGPAALGNIGSNNLGAQALLILAVICYAIYAVMTRRAPDIPARSFAAGTLLCSAIGATPLALLAGQDLTQIPLSGWAVIIALGIGPSGIAAIIIIGLIRKLGAGFMAMANYGTPVVAILFGMLIFNEPLKPTFILGLVAILSGLALSQSRPASARSAIIKG